MMDLQPLWDWFRDLHATTGIKLTIFYDAFDRARFINGFLTSVRLMSICIVCSVIIGCSALGCREVAHPVDGRRHWGRSNQPDERPTMKHTASVAAYAYCFAARGPPRREGLSVPPINYDTGDQQR